MSSLYDTQNRRRFLVQIAADVLGLAVLAGCGVSQNPLASDDPEVAGKTTSGTIKRMRVYQAVHRPLYAPGSALDALELAQGHPQVRRIAGQPFVDAVNNRRGFWLFTADGEFPEGGRILRVGGAELVDPWALEGVLRGSLDAVFDGTSSRCTAETRLYARRTRPRLVSWFRVSLA